MKVGVNPSAQRLRRSDGCKRLCRLQGYRDLEGASEADLDVLILIRDDELSSLIHRLLVTSLVMEALVTCTYVLTAIEHEDEPKCNAYL